MLVKHMGLSAEAMHRIIENGIFLSCAENKCGICSLAHLICHSMCCGRVLFSWWNTRAVDEWRAWSRQVSENLLTGSVLPVLCFSKMSALCILYLILPKFFNSSHVKLGILYIRVFFLKEVYVHL